MDPLTPLLARQNLTDHPHYRYRGCAPDPDQPTRSAGNLDLSIDAWAPWTGDEAEPQRTRLAREKAAMTVCAACPVLTLCRTYANTETDDGHLAEPEGILGGQLALTRHRALIARRTTTPAPISLSEARTPQRLALLAALARDTDDELIAYRAGMDVRTARWHRSALTTLLGLDKEHATRMQLLTAARAHGLLPERTRIVPDGRWALAAAPNTDGTRQRRLAPHRPIQLALLHLTDLPTPDTAPPPAPAQAVRTGARPGLALVRTRPVHEQLALPAPLHLAAAA